MKVQCAKGYERVMSEVPGKEVQMENTENLGKYLTFREMPDRYLSEWNSAFSPLSIPSISYHHLLPEMLNSLLTGPQVPPLSSQIHFLLRGPCLLCPQPPILSELIGLRLLAGLPFDFFPCSPFSHHIPPRPLSSFLPRAFVLAASVGLYPGVLLVRSIWLFNVKALSVDVLFVFS